jgi:hypothetical protein
MKTYSGRVDNIIERELSDEGVEFEEKREGLTDTTFDIVSMCRTDCHVGGWVGDGSG